MTMTMTTQPFPLHDQLPDPAAADARSGDEATSPVTDLAAVEGCGVPFDATSISHPPKVAVIARGPVR
jgi:hypothetical protein